ncbi:ABC transporter permease [Christiangramia sp.]|uniref:ABC transporter permease n=1 Tax=Christiangramia sp. TaxID=1931228 RepID=UPI002602B0A8|nr:ABC transporter permease [Christiangramia sp.]
MIRNYLKIALRNLWKEKTFTGLNVIGLTVAFGVAFLLCAYALFELSYDQFHENKDSIYQVYTNQETPQGTESSDSNPVPFAAALQSEVPGVKKISRYTSGGPAVRYNDKTFRISAVWVDPDFFDMFTFPVIQGKSENPLSEKTSMALTEETAARLFGDENPLGKTLELQQNGEQVPVTVTAVLENYPASSSIGFEAVFNFKNLPNRVYADNIDRWDKHNHNVYLQLDNSISIEQFENSTKTFSELHFANDINNAKRDGAQANPDGNYRQIKLLPVPDRSFVSIEKGVLSVSKTLQYLILAIALLILFIASVNFINMSIAKGANRLREIGMRKTLGAGKSQLFLQFWGESLIIFMISIVLGALLASALLKPFQDLFRTEASLQVILHPGNILVLSLSLLLITFIAGGYPALLMSKLGILQALKGKMKATGKNKVRDVLIIIQFSIAIVLISGTLVLWNQLEFMRSKELGFNKEQVISLPISSSKSDKQILQLLRDELQTNPNILSVSASNNILGMGKDRTSMTSVMGFEYQGREVKTNILAVDYDYTETLNINVLEGRTFSRNYAADSLSVVINESMAKQFTEENPLEINLNIDDKLFKVIGVIEDFHFQDLNKEIEPLSLFMNQSSALRYAYIKVKPGNLSGAYDEIKSTWNKIEPEREFLGSFLDENIDRTLMKERTMTTMISSGSILAIMLSCIGLFAISLLVVSQRRKEIGIRKVVGASVGKITLMLTSDFLKLVGIAFLIATPIAWYFSREWLQNYPYRIDLNIWIFLFAGIIAIGIAIFTISFRTIKAAIQNPVKSLRTE